MLARLFQKRNLSSVEETCSSRPNDPRPDAHVSATVLASPSLQAVPSTAFVSAEHAPASHVHARAAEHVDTLYALEYPWREARPIGIRTAQEVKRWRWIRKRGRREDSKDGPHQLIDLLRRCVAIGRSEVRREVGMGRSDARPVDLLARLVNVHHARAGSAAHPFSRVLRLRRDTFRPPGRTAICRQS